jgi:hypothetical protein
MCFIQFPEADLCVEEIGGYSPSLDSAGPDIRAGLADGKTYFSISMMYRLLCNFQMDDMNTDWKQIWCLKVLERVRHFYG